MADYIATDTDLTAVANAIRTRGGTSSSLTFPTGFVTAIANIPGGGAPTLQTKSKSYTPTESAQSESITPDTGYDGLSEVDVSVGAISSTYVGSGVSRNDSSDLSASGATVTAPAGYYESNASASVTSMTLPTSASASATSGYTSKATLSRSTSDQYINIPPGYNSAGGYYKFNAVANGSVTAPSSITGTGSSVSTGTNTLTLSKTISVTPSVTTAGYISSGTAGNSSVSLSASVTTKAATTYHPSTTDQSISSGTYLTGAQTIKKVTTTNLTADNIKSGVTVKIGDTSDDDCVASILGTYTGGGGGVTGVAKGTLTVASNVSSSTNTKITDTSTIGFTPKAFLFYRSDRSATSNHVNAASFITLGTSYYIGTRTRYSSNALSTSGNTTNWTTQSSGDLYFNSNNVYFRSSSSYILASGTWNWVAIQ